MRISFPSFRTILKTAWHRQAPGKSSTQSEWVPSMLRKTRAIPMAGLCFALIVVLEILYQTMEKNHGIRSDNNILVIPIRYLPTAVAVALGITWKSIVWDIKMIMPWSILSRDRWAEPSESLFLNYIHQIEVMAAFAAFKKRHWAMFLGLLTGFLCGAAVAATNSLTYVELLAEVKEPAILRKTSQFDLSNGTLVYPNGTLAIPKDHLGNIPYAAVAVERLPGGHSAPWSNENYAFDSFAPASQDLILENASIEAHVDAFSANMECHHLRIAYKQEEESGDFNKPFILEANQEDIALAGCSLPINWEIKSCYHSTQAWLNVTSCSGALNDQRILAFIAVPEALNSSQKCHDIQSHGDYNSLQKGEISALSTTALLCNAKFSTQEVFIRANASTGETIYHEPTSPTKSVNVYPSIESVLLYLLNPTDSRHATWDTADTEYALYMPSKYYGVDSFFSALNVGRNSTVERKYINNPTTFESDVSNFSSATLAQIVNAFARRNESEPTPGFITSTSSRLFIRGFSLRSLQFVLLVVGLVFILQATILRPKTHLTENPGPIATVAIILAASEAQVEQNVSGYSTISDNET